MIHLRDKIVRLLLQITKRISSKEQKRKDEKEVGKAGLNLLKYTIFQSEIRFNAEVNETGTKSRHNIRTQSPILKVNGLMYRPLFSSEH